MDIAYIEVFGLERANIGIYFVCVGGKMRNRWDFNNKKIWVLANWTEEEVGLELIKRGVDRNDIVAGFHPKKVRAHTGYAVA